MVCVSDKDIVKTCGCCGDSICSKCLPHLKFYEYDMLTVCQFCADYAYSLVGVDNKEII